MLRTLALALIALAAAPAAAQDASSLSRALLARYPEHEIVPQSCAPSARIVATDRICLVDERTRLVRAVRRVALGGDVGAAIRGTDVFFASTDAGGASTRFAGRVWRWDLARDAYLGLGNAADGPVRVHATSFGILYELRAGWILNDGSGAAGRPVHVPPTFPATIVVAGGATYGLDSASTTQVVTVAFDGTRVRVAPHAELRGWRIHASDAAVVTIDDEGRALEVLRLPASAATRITLPPGVHGSTVTVLDASRLLLGSGATRHVLDLGAGTLAAADASVPGPAPLLTASSLVTVQPTASGGLWLGRAARGWVLDGTGAASRRRAPRAARGRCSCTETTLTCARGSITVPDACTEVPELDRVVDSYAETATGARTRESLYTDDGRFRVDRLEADLVRVTRLADGARIWARLFDDALFVQTDDGTYFTSDRSLTARMAIRDGRSLTDAPIAPLAPRADALFRQDLVRDFFAAPAAAAAP